MCIYKQFAYNIQAASGKKTIGLMSLKVTILIQFVQQNFVLLVEWKLRRNRGIRVIYNPPNAYKIVI